jgi:hypothetical protein
MSGARRQVIQDSWLSGSSRRASMREGDHAAVADHGEPGEPELGAHHLHCLDDFRILGAVAHREQSQ